MSQKPTPPNLGHTFKPYNPQKVLKTPAAYKPPTSLKVSKKPKEQL